MREGDGETHPGPSAVRVAFICTANRARSPFAAALLLRHVAPLPISVTSFGTLEQRGAPALLSAIRAAHMFGIDLRDHHARVLSQGVLEEADLVLGFEPFHVASAVVVGGAATSRVFLLTEIVDALLALAPGASDSGDARKLIASADARRRSEAGLPRPLADPVGRPEERFLELYEEIDQLVEIVASRLFGADVMRTG